ncbi:MAG: NAD(P) transhydrogenase subunit alpha [Sphingobacteriales bacterium]|nr:NAD(P) transhydrogenase subunit alpha [Sphingobacteriales bacterium]MCC7223838.1 NAD(P) transhydrogenase subunit alpha [Chitinophagales bacterium]
MQKYALPLLLLLALPLYGNPDAATQGASSDVLVLLLFVLVIAIFLGVEVISKVPSLLHTPLMSGSNAISGITILGAIIAASQEHDTLSSALGGVAVALAMINVAGGYLVTDRMLQMFKKKDK